MELLSKQQRLSLAKVFHHIHDTWSGPIFCLKNKKITVLQENKNFIHGYQNQMNNQNIKEVTESIELKGRIYYKKEGKTALGLEDGNQLKIEQQEQQVRIKLYPEDYEKVKDVSRFNIDGVLYDPDSGWKPIKLFEEISFYECYFKRVV